MPVRAITFDFWQTLFRDRDGDRRFRLRLDALVAATGASELDADTALKDMHREFFRMHLDEQRNLTPSDGVRLVCAALNAELDQAACGELEEIFATAVLQFPPEPIPGAREAVEAASRRVPVGLISDVGLSPSRCIKQLLDRHGFLPHFQTLTFSHEIGVSKPQPQMFHVTAEALGVQPNEILHIGDLEPTDIAGIQRQGGTAALFTGVNDKFKATTRAEYVFDDWERFIAALPIMLVG